MKEIEVKIPDINKKEVEKILMKLGAKLIFEGEIKAHYFDFKNNDLRKRKEVLRLRTVGKKAFLAYKGKPIKNEANIREELETEVSSFETIKKTLEGVGFHEWLRLKKKRTSYKFGKAMIEIDEMKGKYSFIPTFIEIEAPDVKTIHETANKLGFKKEDCKTWGFSKLIERYSKQVKI